MKWFIDESSAEQVRLAAEKMGQDLRAARLARHCPQWDAAMRSGMSLSTYKRLEAGDTSVALRLWLQAWVKAGLLELLADATSPHRAAECARRRRIWAIVWVVKLFDITKLGWPVAQPRFMRRPSANMMIEWPSGNVHSWTCGLISMRWTSLILARPATSISLSKWPMLQTIAWCFIRAMCSAEMMPLLPVVVT